MLSKKSVGSAVLALCLGALGFAGGCSSGDVANPSDDGNSQGGSSSGGASSGGTATGGFATGGTGFSGASGSTSGTAGVAGTPAGGAGGLGGTAGTGATATGGSAGAAATGGTATGGTATGGTATGGTATGGTATGGTAGAAATGGSAGAAATGGSAGAAATGGRGGSGAASGASGSAGTGPGCAGGQILCSNACVNTMTNPANCGACGTACATGQTCSNGSCMGGTTTSGVIGWAAVNGSGVATTTGGSGGTTIDVSSASALSSAASSSTRQIIRLTASVSVSRLVVGSNKTILGVGPNIVISGGIELNNQNNVILQNFRLNGASSAVSAGDGIRVTNSHHIWIDHLEVYDAADGNLDITDRSNFITVSWTKFRYSTNSGDHRYSNLIGAGDAETGDEALLNVTWHHNWWAQNVHERMPRVRFGDVHVFNNYYSSSGNNYCIRAGFHSNVLIENNHFQGVGKPHEIGEDSGTAIVTARGNTYSSTSGAQTSRGTAFTPPYPYTLDAVGTISAAVQSGAGPH